ncbi:MAG: N-acetyltransferase [Clostridium sp.]
MIRKLRENDLAAVIEIWLDSNIKAHYFIPKEYWISNYPAVKEMLPQAEVYVYEEEDTQQIIGFIGLTENYIVGIFVQENAQSRGIGKRLLNYVKEIKTTLSLSVYQKNMRAISFYQREQFIIQSKNIDDNNEKEFIMSWKK